MIDGDITMADVCHKDLISYTWAAVGNITAAAVGGGGAGASASGIVCMVGHMAQMLVRGHTSAIRSMAA
jgi:hypothetical protein